MAKVPINPVRIEGLWKSGWALDLHTLSSTPIGQDEWGNTRFETQRPAVAELLYRLKYRGDRDAAGPIIETAADFLGPYRHQFDVIVPVPPTRFRLVQPVPLLANGIGDALGLPVKDCVGRERGGTEIKGIADIEERGQAVDSLFHVDPRMTERQRILLFDDLYRSGTTMNAITREMLGSGKAAAVYAFTITKTRSNR